jgi:hypothetical protein
MGFKPLYVKLQTKKTPEIRLVYDDQVKAKRLIIKGRCIPENPIEFFSPVIEKLRNKYKPVFGENAFFVDLDLEYINSISIKFLVKILNNIAEIYGKENIKIDWFYEDEDSYDMGKDFEFITGLQFNFIEK